MKKQKNKCEHKKLYKVDEIQEGYKVSGWKCADCEEWIEEDFDPFEYEFGDNFTS
ncbi:MAG: hypothetical protein QXY47_05395 [Thermoplasmata archaeon]